MRLSPPATFQRSVCNYQYIYLLHIAHAHAHACLLECACPMQTQAVTLHCAATCTILPGKGDPLSTGSLQVQTVNMGTGTSYDVPLPTIVWGGECLYVWEIETQEFAKENYLSAAGHTWPHQCRYTLIYSTTFPYFGIFNDNMFFVVLQEKMRKII